MLKIFWAGVDVNNKGVWGYFVDEKIHSSGFGNIKLLQTFWGRPASNFYFQTTPNTVQFQKRAKRKTEIYKYKFDDNLKKKLNTEYEKYVLFRKLKGEYE